MDVCTRIKLNIPSNSYFHGYWTSKLSFENILHTERWKHSGLVISLSTVYIDVAWEIEWCSTRVRGGSEALKHFEMKEMILHHQMFSSKNGSQLALCYK